jgi:hypothetical protein
VNHVLILGGEAAVGRRTLGGAQLAA